MITVVCQKVNGTAITYNRVTKVLSFHKGFVHFTDEKYGEVVWSGNYQVKFNPVEIAEEKKQS